MNVRWSSFFIFAMMVMMAVGGVHAQDMCDAVSECPAGTTIPKDNGVETVSCDDIPSGSEVFYHITSCTGYNWGFVIYDENDHVYIEDEYSGYAPSIQYDFITLEGTATSLYVNFTCNDEVRGFAGDDCVTALSDLSWTEPFIVSCPVSYGSSVGYLDHETVSRARHVRDQLPWMISTGIQRALAILQWTFGMDNVARWIAPLVRVGTPIAWTMLA